MTRGTGLFLIAVSVSVLVGWTFDVSALKGLSGDITMKANAALALLALGVAIFALTSERRSARISAARPPCSPVFSARSR